MDDDDFARQLKYEEEEKQRKLQTETGNDPYTYVDQTDGTVYEWDFQKQAWFPKLSEDLIAAYQANYGGQEDSTPVANAPVETKSAAMENKQTEKRKAAEAAWFDVDDAHNTNVYVSGLPLDMTEEEYVELMSKCGLIMKDVITNQYKIKMYRTPDGIFKGDGLCCYIKIESVQLALTILHGYRIKDKVIHVERAKFQMKGNYDPSKKPKKKKPKDKDKIKKKIEKLFDWRPDKLRGQRLKCEKTVIIKNMFDQKEFEHDATLILEYQRDVRDECAKYGEVKKVVVYDRNPEGVVSVTFAEPEEADQCILVMNRRWFAGRQLSAETWDGKTKFKIEETEDELDKRLKQWDQFLDEPPPQKQTDDSSSAVNTISTSDPTSMTIVEMSTDWKLGDKLSNPNENLNCNKVAELTDEEKHSGEDSDDENRL